MFIDMKVNDDGQERPKVVISSSREPQEAGPGAGGPLWTDSPEQVLSKECRAAVSHRFTSQVCFALILISLL